uniref:Uncharacterized protein n=1 Tax=Poecilia mexicana TaxID=48701 RepID=A0A3B3Z564_9TELE
MTISSPCSSWKMLFTPPSSSAMAPASVSQPAPSPPIICPSPSISAIICTPRSPSGSIWSNTTSCSMPSHGLAGLTCLRLDVWEKDLEQMEQLVFLNDLPHSLQTYGLSPVWTFLCRRRLLEFLNALEQESHGYGHSPVCCRR